MNFNPYQITWAFLIPTKGIARKQDESFQFQRGVFNSYLAAHAPTKEKALEKVETLKGTLTKEYKVLLITDKQFGLLKQDFTNKTHNLLQIATKKQLWEVFTIK